jgi:hypothetical protein
VNVASLISSFSTGTYTVTRTATRNLSKGKATAGTTSTVSITASVWPARSNDLMRLPEMRRTGAAFTLMTTTELYTGGQGEDYEADTISIDGESWEVSAVDKWTDSDSGGVAYKCIVTAAR